jgi:POT family proton-dependent oligopeptide transporter
MLCIGVLLFVLGTPRYVRDKPSRDLFSKEPKAANVDSSIGLTTVFRISILIVPFCIAYSQMATTFIIQGNVMKKAFGFIDAASMNNADAISVLFFGYVIGAFFYPALADRGIKIPTTYKFAIGSGLGAMAIAWSLLMEHKIRSTYEATGEQVNIMWQSLAYILIGCGEIFAVSAAYEAAFTAAPPEKKVLASAVNLFCVGGIPNVLCIFLYQACRGWFLNSRGTASLGHISDYASAHTDYYFLVLFGISLLGIVVNLLPSVRDFVQSIEDKATEMVKTPVIKKPTRHRRKLSSSDYSSDEESPMLRVKRHQAYLKYGSGPVLYKQGSMRAGPFGSQKNKERKSPKRTLKKSQVGKLYRIKIKSKTPKVVLNSDGKPMTAGNLHKRQDSM